MEYATEIVTYGSGKNNAGWWEKMVKQAKMAIAIFNKAFPEDMAGWNWTQHGVPRRRYGMQLSQPPGVSRYG
jgi:hypothetical protein